MSKTDLDVCGIMSLLVTNYGVAWESYPFGDGKKIHARCGGIVDSITIQDGDDLGALEGWAASLKMRAQEEVTRIDCATDSAKFLCGCGLCMERDIAPDSGSDGRTCTANTLLAWMLGKL